MEGRVSVLVSSHGSTNPIKVDVFSVFHVSLECELFIVVMTVDSEPYHVLVAFNETLESQTPCM